ncbi:MAG: phosphoribosylanthranilate isomerase [Synechococcaceae cyanobacterium]|nr:phosphoribosylanthranilate isomerase [Synechococcaceae cyanobacterium]
MPLVKICGLRHPDQAAAVASLGADAIGVIGVSASPRWVPAERRAALFAAAAGGKPDCFGVLVVADPADADLKTLDSRGGHQVLQLHGQESAQRCAQLRQQLDVKLWKALRISKPGDLALAAAYEGVVDALLLDCWDPQQLGGTGRSIPLGWLHGFSPALPWWLAGGLHAGNLTSVLDAVSPTGLDLSSGVEDAPGEKNLVKVAELFALLREHVAPVGP